MGSDLKPCPSCGTDDVYSEDSIYSGKHVWFVNCTECGMTGPISDECEKAFTSWNTLPRKIKLIKELPTEEGGYFWCEGDGQEVEHCFLQMKNLTVLLRL